MESPGSRFIHRYSPRRVLQLTRLSDRSARPAWHVFGDRETGTAESGRTVFESRGETTRREFETPWSSPRSRNSQMDASLHPRSWHLLASDGCLLDRVVARCIEADAACQSLGRITWEESKNRLPYMAWNAKFQFAAVHRYLALIGDLDRILTVLLKPQCEFPAFDLLESSCSKEIEHHILRARDLRIC